MHTSRVMSVSRATGSKNRKRSDHLIFLPSILPSFLTYIYSHSATDHPSSSSPGERKVGETGKCSQLAEFDLHNILGPTTTVKASEELSARSQANIQLCRAPFLPISSKSNIMRSLFRMSWCRSPSNTIKTFAL